MPPYYNTSPNMQLPVPIPTLTIGPAWAQYLYTCLYSQIDAHDHSNGKGVQVQPDGLNISTNLTFQGNAATNLLASGYTSQASPLSTATYPSYLYVSGGNLYYNSASTQIQLTTPTAVNVTSTGISSGTASASFVSSILVVNEASNTPGTIQAGNYLMGDNTTDGYFVDIQPPTLSASYSLTLPPKPAASSFLTITSGGVITGSITTSQGITASNIASQTITATQIANATITGTQIAAETVTNGNLAASNTSGLGTTINFSTTSISAVPVINSTTSAISTTGHRVVMVGLQSGNSSAAYVGLSFPSGTENATATIFFQNSTNAGSTWTTIAEHVFGNNVATFDSYYPPSSFTAYDYSASANSSMYRLQVASASSSVTVSFVNCTLVATEL